MAAHAQTFDAIRPAQPWSHETQGQNRQQSWEDLLVHQANSSTISDRLPGVQSLLGELGEPPITIPRRNAAQHESHRQKQSKNRGVEGALLRLAEDLLQTFRDWDGTESRENNKQRTERGRTRQKDDILWSMLHLARFATLAMRSLPEQDILRVLEMLRHDNDGFSVPESAEGISPAVERSLWDRKRPLPWKRNMSKDVWVDKFYRSPV